MTAVGLAFGAALALALLGAEIARSLCDPSSSRLAELLSACAWLLSGTFLTLVVAQLANYLG